MSKHIKSILFSFIFIDWVLGIGVQSHSDTLQLKSSSILFLSNKFVIPESIQITYKGELISADTIDWIKGKLVMPSVHHSKNQEFIINYEYLEKGLPLHAGPKWKSLPYLDLDENLFDKNSEPVFNMNVSDNGLSTIHSSGSIYRQLNLSPLGGSDFSGGLHMQLNGELGDNMQISGVLSDRNLPLQSEGITQDLDAFDQIYISIKSKNYSTNAGDVIYDYKYANDYRINRKLVGLKNNFHFNDWKGSSVYAGSKGSYHAVNMKGRDGDQGPYRLQGKDGNKDIIILSGTEKVWVNGMELIRGYNHDYIIDYSLAEIYFTANIIIYYDSDIYIEFQYSDLKFSKGFSGGIIEKSLNQNGKVSIGFFQELDQFDKSSWSNQIKDSLASTPNGKIQIKAHDFNDLGDYVLIDSVYIYDPDHYIDEGRRCQTDFFYDKNGSYIRQISLFGRVYYKYIPFNERNNSIDLYSPYRNIIAPQNHRFGFFNANYHLGKNLSIEGFISGSGIDKNILSVLDKKSKKGISHQFTIKTDSLLFGPMILQFELSDWLRDDAYHSLGDENNIRQQTYWNENEINRRGVRESNLKTEVSIEGLGTTLMERSNFKTGKKNLIATYLHQKIHNSSFKNSQLNLLEIDKPLGKFRQIYGRFNYHSSNYSPFLFYDFEHDPMKTLYKLYGSGITYDSENRNLEIGAHIRNNDIKKDIIDDYWERESEDVVSFLNYKTKNRHGWSNDITYKRRIKSFMNNSTNIDYYLARIHSKYHQISSPFKWDFRLKTEESFTQQRVVVYDSIGPGLGQYRYEPELNTYISDQNGSYVAYTVQTGERNPTTLIETVQYLTYDFGKINGLPNILVRFNNKIDFRGNDFNLKRLVKSSLLNSSTVNSKLLSRMELDFYGSNRILTWFDLQRSLSGIDPRGNDLINHWELGCHVNRYLNKLFSLQFRSIYTSKDIQSNRSLIRIRSVEGWWHELHILLNRNAASIIDFAIIRGDNKGKLEQDSYSSNTIGFAFNGKIFINKVGRIQTKLEWTNISTDPRNTYLPPEALNGYTLGKGIRTDTRLQYYLNRTLSLNISINTIHNSLYKKLITLQGEIRAHF